MKLFRAYKTPDTFRILSGYLIVIEFKLIEKTYFFGL